MAGIGADILSRPPRIGERRADWPAWPVARGICRKALRDQGMRSPLRIAAFLYARLPRLVLEFGPSTSPEPSPHRNR